MKKTILTLFLMLLLLPVLKAQSVNFSKPTDSQVFNMTSGQSTKHVQVQFGYPAVNDPRFKLTTHSTAYESRTFTDIPQDFYLSGGTYTFTIEVWTNIPGLGDQFVGSDQVTFYVRPALTADNSFGGGTIKVNSATVTAPYSLNPASSTSLEAIDQFKSPYMKRFKEWLGPAGSSTSRSISASAPTTANVTYTADFRNEYNISFQNNFASVGNGGVIKVNSTQYSSPTANFQVLQDLTITGTAVYQVINGIEYNFSQWSDGSTSSTRTFTPGGHATYTASYTGRPNNSYRSLVIPSAVGQPITLDWNEHPNTAVTAYYVYRKVKHNGVMGSEQLIGSCSRGTTTFTDNLYIKTSTYVEDLIYYDVRAYYSTEGTYSVVDYISVYGETFAKENDATAQNMPIEFSLSNHPNPFNPSTNINFSIPEAASVKLTIYNMLGEKVKELLNRNMEAGSYTEKWNGENQSGGKVISGIYFSVLQTNNKRIVQKMVLSK